MVSLISRRHLTGALSLTLLALTAGTIPASAQVYNFSFAFGSTGIANGQFQAPYGSRI